MNIKTIKSAAEVAKTFDKAALGIPDLLRECTEKSYADLIYTDVVAALAGRQHDFSEAEQLQNEVVRSWGLSEHPDFQLPAAKVQEAVSAAKALRAALTIRIPRK